MIRVLAALLACWGAAGLISTVAWIASAALAGRFFKFSMRAMILCTAWGTAAIFAFALARHGA